MNARWEWQAMVGSWLQGGAEFKWSKVAGNEDVHVTMEGIYLHNWCLQAKVKAFLETFLVKLVLLLIGMSMAPTPSMALRSRLGLQQPTCSSSRTGVSLARDCLLCWGLRIPPSPVLLSCFSLILGAWAAAPEQQHVWSLLIQKVIYLLLTCCAEQ